MLHSTITTISLAILMIVIATSGIGAAAEVGHLTHLRTDSQALSLRHLLSSISAVT